MVRSLALEVNFFFGQKTYEVFLEGEARLAARLTLFAASSLCHHRWPGGSFELMSLTIPRSPLIWRCAPGLAGGVDVGKVDFLVATRRAAPEATQSPLPRLPQRRKQ